MTERDPYDDLLEEAKKLSLRVQAILKGQPHEAMSAALVDVVSVFIAGHIVLAPGDKPRQEPWSQETLEKTRQQRAAMLSKMVLAIEALVPVSAAERGLPHDPIDPDPERWGRAFFQRH